VALFGGCLLWQASYTRSREEPDEDMRTREVNASGDEVGVERGPRLALEVDWIDLRGKGVMVDQYAMNLSLNEDVNEVRLPFSCALVRCCAWSHRHRAPQIAIAPNAEIAVACLDSGDAVVVDIETKQPKRVIRAHSQVRQRQSFDPRRAHTLSQICTSVAFVPGQPTDGAARALVSVQRWARHSRPPCILHRRPRLACRPHDARAPQARRALGHAYVARARASLSCRIASR